MPSLNCTWCNKHITNVEHYRFIANTGQMICNVCDPPKCPKCKRKNQKWFITERYGFHDGFTCTEDDCDYRVYPKPLGCPKCKSKKYAEVFIDEYDITVTCKCISCGHNWDYRK